MAWTYILRCDDGSFYTGSTNGDLESRVWEHNNDDYDAARFTRKRRPVVLVYAEQFDTVDAAFRREKQIQGWSRVKKLALIELRAPDLPALSRSRGGDASTGSAPQNHKNQPDGDASTGSATQNQKNQPDADASTGSATQNHKNQPGADASTGSAPQNHKNQPDGNASTGSASP